MWLAAGAVAVVTAAWAVPTLAALAGGMDRADSLWYHMPLAARFAETGDLGRIDYFDPIFFASYYPANSEVFHATALLGFGRDLLSPLLNLGWLALGLVGLVLHRASLRRRAAGADRRCDRARLADADRVPGG